MHPRSGFGYWGTSACTLVPVFGTGEHPNVPSFRNRNQEKGVLAKGVSVESGVTANDITNTQGYWAQHYIWRSERHSQERPAFLQKPPSKKPFFLGS